MNAVCESTKLPQVSEQLDYLEKNVSELRQYADDLEKRLGAVVHQLPGIAVNQNKTPVGPPDNLVGLAGRIKSNNDFVASVNQQIRSILDRIEL